VFYLALGYFILWLPCVLGARALCSNILHGLDRPPGGLMLAPDGRTAQADKAAERAGQDATNTSTGVGTNSLETPMTEAAYAVIHEAGMLPQRSRPLLAEHLP